VHTGEVALQGGRAALHQIAGHRFPREAGSPDREVIDSARRTTKIQRHQCPVVAEPDNLDSVLLGLADHRKPEHLLIEIDRPLQIAHLNTDMVDGRGFEADVCLRGCCRSARGEHR
jgi:hypothetical protein